MHEHRCRPPEGRQPFTVSPWTCPECERVWKSRPKVDLENPPIATGYDFATHERFTPSTWVLDEL